MCPNLRESYELNIGIGIGVTNRTSYSQYPIFLITHCGIRIRTPMCEVASTTSLSNPQDIQSRLKYEQRVEIESESNKQIFLQSLRKI